MKQEILSLNFDPHRLMIKGEKKNNEYNIHKDRFDSHCFGHYLINDEQNSEVSQPLEGFKLHSFQIKAPLLALLGVTHLCDLRNLKFKMAAETESRESESINIFIFCEQASQEMIPNGEKSFRFVTVIPGMPYEYKNSDKI